MTKAIITLPLSPIKADELGRMTTPIVGNAIAHMLDANFYLSVNLLDSFKDRTLDFLRYKEVITNLNLSRATYWLDKDNQEELINLLNTLIKKNIVYEMKTNIFKCPCGVVEIEEKNLASTNPNKAHYEVRNNEIYCTKCKRKCEKIWQDVLVFDPRKINIKPIIFKPDFLNKDIKTFDKNIKESYQVISRARATGININYNDKNYNIDIDFLWSLYLTLFKEDEKIVMCGNHEVYQLYYACLIEKCFNSNAKTIALATPYLTGLNSLSSKVNNQEQELINKLGILFNLKWARKEKEYDKTIFNYIEKLSLDKKIKLYQLLTKPINCSNILDEDINLVLKRFNMQNLVNEMKRG